MSLLSALSSLSQTVDQLCSKWQQQRQRNDEIRKLIREASGKRVAVASLYTSISNQNQMLTESLKLIEGPSAGLVDKWNKLQMQKEQMKKLKAKHEDWMNRLAENMNTVMALLQDEEQRRTQLVADAAGQVTGQFTEQLAQLDAQMDEDRRMEVEIRNEMAIADRAHKQQIDLMQQRAKQELSNIRKEVVKKMSREDHEIEKIDLQREGQKAALRHEADGLIESFRKQLKHKQKERTDLATSVNMLSDSDRRSVFHSLTPILNCFKWFSF